MYTNSRMNRRKVLRGVIGGGAVTVALPFLDCFLNSNGDARADGTELPVIFGTWYGGLGFSKGSWEPKGAGANYENNDQFKSLDPHKKHINIFSGLRAFLDAHPFNAHGTCQPVSFGGGIPADTRGDKTAAFASIDVLIGDAIGSKTRFRSLEVACDGSSTSYSKRSATSTNPAERSPAAFYKRIFGPDYTDPNAAEFTPDPVVMARRSALTAVKEQRAEFMKTLGASDKARLDEYFTSLRELEQQIDLQLQKPAPIQFCTVPSGAVEDAKHTGIVEDISANQRLFSKLLVHALACDQTRVTNVFVDQGGLRLPGRSQKFHTYTHEEAMDDKLGYQPIVWYFQEAMIKMFASHIDTLASFKEGDRTLLDRSLTMYHTDHGEARLHTLENVPMLTAGSANGRVKTGLSVVGGGSSLSRVGLTVQQAFGVPISSWGTESNQSTKPFSEILA